MSVSGWRSLVSDARESVDCGAFIESFASSGSTGRVVLASSFVSSPSMCSLIRCLCEVGKCCSSEELNFSTPMSSINGLRQ